MKGSAIRKKLGVNQTHCFVEREMFEIDEEQDYAVVRGTEDHPRIACVYHEKMIEAGRYPRLKIDRREIVSDTEWISGHNAFEGDVEPKFSPARDKGYMIQ